MMLDKQAEIHGLQDALYKVEAPIHMNIPHGGS